MANIQIGKPGESKVNNSVNRAWIDKMIDQGRGGRWISIQLEKQFGEKISHSAIHRYQRNRLNRIRARVEKECQKLEDEHVMEDVSSIAFLRGVVAKSYKALETVDVEVKDGIQAAKVLLEKDKTNEFIIQIMGEGDYEVVAKALEMMSDDSKREFLEAVRRIRESNTTEQSSIEEN